MYMSIKTLDYVIFSHQANLSKTTKHWDSFVSHCICKECGSDAIVKGKRERKKTEKDGRI